MPSVAGLIDRFLLPVWGLSVYLILPICYWKASRWSFENAIRYFFFLGVMGVFGRFVQNYLIKRRDPDILISISAMIFVGGGGAALVWTDAHSIPAWSQALGYLFVVASCGLWIWSLGQHSQKISYAGAHDQPPTNITATGPYAFIRHPIYFSYVLVWLGEYFLSHLNLIFPMFLVHVAIMSHYARAEENQFLSSKSAKAYAGYMKAVPYRLFPFVRFL